jgi:hypothetical protein
MILMQNHQKNSKNDPQSIKSAPKGAHLQY